ncbi:tetratricopeptide repeat protein [Vibrio sp. TRT 17S01]|uniref:tetratricopeptide repeat protein n=1 Tax=Vibrio sp. TRT 17S01 TaxID=3418505 RepID=UPI003CFA7CC1
MMLVKVFRRSGVVLALWACTISGAMASNDLSDLSADQAFEKGKLLRWQLHHQEALPYLKHAAEKGSAEAAYIYSIELEDGSEKQGEEEYHYALRAAEQGNLLAMLKVSSSSNPERDEIRQEWEEKTQQAILERAEAGNPEAMLLLHTTLEKEKDKMAWLEKAVAANHPEAKFKLAQAYEAGYDWFFIPGKRSKETKRLYQESAEQGYPPAMKAYMEQLLAKKKTREEGFEWMKKLAEIGRADSLLLIANTYAEDRQMRDIVPQDRVKALSYLYAYFESMATPKSHDSLHRAYQKKIAIHRSLLSEEEGLKADAMAEDYLANHTVRAYDDLWQWGVDYGERTTPEQPQKNEAGE